MPIPTPEASRSPTVPLLYLAFALAGGLCVGLLGTGFHLAVDWLTGAYSTLRALAPSPFIALIVAIAGTALLATAARWLVLRFAPEAAGSGIQEIEGVLEGERELRPLRVLLVKFSGGVLALGSGMVLGREGPTIHMGAALMQLVSGVGRLGQEEKRGLLAAGAAAGLAAAFLAPLAAILFVIEETRRQVPYRAHTYMAVFLASIGSAAIAEALLGQTVSLPLASPGLSPLLLPVFALLGGAVGLLGLSFNRTVVLALDAPLRLPQRLWWLPALVVGAAMGAMLQLFPEGSGGGEAVVQLLAHEAAPLGFLLALMMLRFTAAILCYGTGVPGGIFAPMLSIAVAAGLAFGTAAEVLLPDVEGLARATAIAAMAGLFAASVRAPLVGVVLVLELTGAYGLVLPVLVTAACASLTAQVLGGRPIYETLLERTLRLAGQTQPEPRERTPVQLGMPD
ncbi:H(+)/Cl(-) exchange transporter ClcA [Pannonibacter sp.]|uniref:H(+)/Cl(-) exchange transporter ClcA n=1 Tax=Pannonibacter sp. TaxID=1906786 RepID=UPI003F6F00C6